MKRRNIFDKGNGNKLCFLLPTWRNETKESKHSDSHKLEKSRSSRFLGFLIRSKADLSSPVKEEITEKMGVSPRAK